MTGGKSLSFVAALGTSVLCAIVQSKSYAQTATATSPANPAEGTASLAEIVVTAQRRAESLQDVPLSVSAVTASQLADTGITGIDQLSMDIPALNIQDGGGYLLMHLRGVGATTVGAGLENPVALYVDGVYRANQSTGLFSFNDIAQIEVLKGPQGTLFGRNATGGLIQVTTAEPGQTFQLKTDAGASNFHGAGGNLYVAGGIAENLAADVAIQGSRSDGYGTNLFNGQDVYAEPWNLAIRSKWVYTQGDWKATLIGDYSNTDNSYNGLAAIPGSYVIRPILPAPALGSNPWDNDVDAQPLVKQTDMGVSLKVERTFDFMTLSNLAAARRSTFESQFDDDATPLPIESVHIAQRDWQISDELQLTSSASGPLKWTTGIYYFYDESENDPTTVSLGSTPALNPEFPVGQVFVRGKQDSASIAGYGQLTYDLTDQLAVTGGLRYSHEHRILNDASQMGALLVPGNPVVPLGPPIPERNESFSDPTYRLALDFKVTQDLMVYGSFNTGFKSGGYNVSNPTDPAFEPEKLYAYELGEKAELLDHRLRINSAVFYYDYDNIQVQKAEPTGAGIINGARATLYGLDSEIKAIPVTQLELGAGLSLLHTKFNSFPDAPLSTPGGGVRTTVGSAAGNALPYSPKGVVDLSATYFAMPTLSLTAVYYHSSSFFFEPDNVANQSSYDKVNGSVLWTARSKRYWVRIYGNNLTNAAVKGAVLTNPAGVAEQTLQPPRVYGIKVGYEY
jgi:iron complex outermembrane recepter protein